MPSPLAELLAHIERQSVPPAHVTAQHAATPAPAITAAPELKALRTFRDTWSRLNAEQKLKQSRLKLPQNAGPLNSHQLVHRALTLMRDRSPAYLDRFLAHADALLALEQIVGAVAPPPKEQPRAEGERKRAGRGKAG